jgi:hypothetical protein
VANFEYPSLCFLAESVRAFKGDFKILVEDNPSFNGILVGSIGSLEEIFDQYFSFEANDQL